jgi:hypothetical protein
MSVLDIKSNDAAPDDFVVAELAQISVGLNEAKHKVPRTVKTAGDARSRIAHFLVSLKGHGTMNMNEFVLEDHALLKELRAIAAHQAMVQESAGTSRRPHQGNEIVR